MGNKKKPYLKRKWARTLKETMKIAREAKSQKKLCSETTKKSMESPEFIDLMPVQLVNGMDTVQNAATEVNSVIETPQNGSIEHPPTELTELESIESDMKIQQESLNADSKCKELNGRRIINMQMFFDNLKTIADHSSLFNCGLTSIEIISEYRKGLYSRLNLQCSMCNKTFKIETTDQDINKEAVAGIIASGGGYVQLKQVTSAIDLPEINEKMYLKIQDGIADDWEKTAWEEMKIAGELERTLSLKEGRVNKDGIPMIDVIVDGCWSRRSYQKNYAASSGCATIIGRRTGKVLFMAVKNKYCCICQRNGENAKTHRCYKNYVGSSTGMEATIIAEGFKKSVEMHNLIYQRFIADGDSSTYAKIIETRPYSNVTVEKLNCRNHILRRFCNNMQKLCTDTRYSVKDRKLVTKGRIMLARKYIRDAIKHNKVDRNVEKLHHDINNAVFHAFGKHAKCNKDICSQTDDKVTEFDMCSLWQKIKMLAANVASHSRSLVEDVDSNIVEQFNSIIAKLVGGKRINYSRRRGYQTRCAGAVISFNTKRLLSTVHRNKYNKSPRKSITKYEDQIRLKREKAKMALRKRKLYFIADKPDASYGEYADQPDLDAESLKTAKETFLNNLRLTENQRTRITQQTVLQSQCSEWLELRRNLLTASNFGKIIKRKKNSSCQNLVKNMLYSTPIDHVSSIQHGRQYEAVALEQLSKLRNIEIKKCGLFIDAVHPFLGATPDGITDDMVVEVKCPIVAFKLGSIDTAIDQNKLHFWKKNKHGDVYVNKKSDWYIQAQGQMHIANRSKCLFAAWYGDHKLKIEILEKDDDFWKKEMEPKLTNFYLECLLPELVDPRYPRKKPIRDPEYVITKNNKVSCQTT